MNDYKELIAELRNFTIVGFNNNKFPIVRYPSELERKAADIIEHLAMDIDVLTKERDAAVNDLVAVCTLYNVANICNTCKYSNFEDCGNMCKYEWRGVQE